MTAPDSHSIPILPRKILAIKLRALGDTVLMTAPLIELRKAFPQAEIHALVPKKWAALLDNHPSINKIIPVAVPDQRWIRIPTLLKIGMGLREEKYDCVLAFHASPSTATIARVSGAQVRSVHFHGHRDRDRFSTVTVPGKGILKPIIERDMDTVRALNVHVPAGREPKITLLDSEKSRARDRLAKLGLQGSILGLGLGASRPTKSWPIERFAALAIGWCESVPGPKAGGVIAFTGPGEEDKRHAFLAAVEDLLREANLAPERRNAIRSRITTEHGVGLRELAASIAQLSVFMGNDSGPKHLAIAVGTPTVTVFGPEDPFEWHPYSKDRNPFFFIEGLACRKDADPSMPPWCGLDECIIESHQCMRKIGVSSVLAECRKVGTRA